MSGNEPMPTHGLDKEFPMMWVATHAVDLAEKSGQDSAIGPIHREMEAAMRELWMARTHAEGLADLLTASEIEPRLGLATTGQLLDELRARAEMNGTIGYRTVDSA